MWTARLVAPRAGRRFLLCTLFSWLGNGGGRQRESEGAQIRVSSKRRQRWSPPTSTEKSRRGGSDRGQSARLFAYSLTVHC